jgi:ubiquinone/menaquinone biosynthesis C-methylase UbiE
VAQSISFDRAADFYDETRKLEPQIASAITEAILSELRQAGAERVLEIGVGTGRMARPLMAEGIEVTGVDISMLMMAKLLDQLSEEHRRPLLLLADATALPFRDGAFPAVLAVHVLHLVSSVPEAVSEIKRVLGPGGVLLHQTHRDTEVLRPSGDKFDEFLRRYGHQMPARSYFEDAATILEKCGAVKSVVEVASETIESDPARILADSRAKIHSWTWRMPDDVFDACWPEYAAWFRDYYGDQPILDEVTYLLETWRWPGG